MRLLKQKRNPHKDQTLKLHDELLKSSNMMIRSIEMRLNLTNLRSINRRKKTAFKIILPQESSDSILRYRINQRNSLSTTISYKLRKKRKADKKKTYTRSKNSLKKNG